MAVSPIALQWCVREKAGGDNCISFVRWFRHELACHMRTYAEQGIRVQLSSLATCVSVAEIHRSSDLVTLEQLEACFVATRGMFRFAKIGPINPNFLPSV